MNGCVSTSRILAHLDGMAIHSNEMLPLFLHIHETMSCACGCICLPACLYVRVSCSYSDTTAECEDTDALKQRYTRVRNHRRINDRRQCPVCPSVANVHRQPSAAIRPSIRTRACINHSFEKAVGCVLPLPPMCAAAAAAMPTSSLCNAAIFQIRCITRPSSTEWSRE